MESFKMEDQSQFLENLYELRLAIIRGNLEDVKNALEKGITVNQPLKGGWTALMYACSIANPAIVAFLLEHGANPNFHKELFTPLMAACASTQKDENRLVRCLELLLQYKANVNSTERHYISPLMFAAKQGHNTVVSRLLSTNCNVNAQDSQGWTALFWAVNQGKARVVQTLVQHGARTNICDRRGQTVIDMARSKGFKQIIATLKNEPSNLHSRHTHLTLISHSDSNNWELPERKYNDDKEDNISSIQMLLDHLSATMNNNGRFKEDFNKMFNNMDIETNQNILKNHSQVLCKVANNLNGSCQSALVLSNKQSKNDANMGNTSVEKSWKNIPYSGSNRGSESGNEAVGRIVRHGVLRETSHARKPPISTGGRQVRQNV